MAFYLKDTDGFPLLAMLKSLDIKINMQRMVIKADPEMLIGNEAQAYPCYLTNEPFVMQKKGIEYNIINPLNYGIDFYGDMLFTNGNEAQNHPQRVEAFKQATLKGWLYALSHKAEIIRLIQTRYQSNKSFEHLMNEANALEEIIHPKSTPIGTLDKGRLAYISSLFHRYGLSEKPFDIDSGIFELERNPLALNSDEQHWLSQNPQVRAAKVLNLPPIAFEENRLAQGIAISYARRLENVTGLQLNWQALPTAVQLKTALDDTSLPEFILTATNADKYNQHYVFSTPYFSSPLVIATQNNEPYIREIKQLQKSTLSVVKGSFAESYLKRQKFPYQLLEVSSTSEGLQAVAKEQARAHLDAAAAIGYSIKNQGFNQVQISGDTQQQVEYRFAVLKSNPKLLSIINKTLQSMSDEDHQKLQIPWLKVDYYQKLSWETLIKFSTPILIVFVLVLLYNRKLKRLNLKLNNVITDLNQAHEDLKITNEKLSILSITDPLTQAYNRTYIDQRLNEELALFKRHQQPLALMMLDLDYFKSVNDIFGHLAGDQVLIKMAQWCQSQCRTEDLFARWGGEEFLILCRNTNLHEASALAERICQGAPKVSLSYPVEQTLSVGVTQFLPGESIETFVNRADQALYLAKNQGRNQVVTL